MGKKKKAKMGRPFKLIKEPLAEMICIRLSASERKRIEAEAKRRGKSISDLLLESFRKLPEKKGK